MTAAAEPITEAFTVLAAEAVKEKIRGLTLTLDGVVSREYVPNFKLKETDTARIPVVCRTDRRTPHTRSHVQHELPVEIGVLFRAGANEIEDADKALKTAEEIALALERQPLETLGAAIPATITRSDPLYDAEHYREWKQVTTILIATYRIIERV